MAQERHIALHLQAAGPSELLDLLRPILDRSLTMLAGALGGGRPSAADLTEKVAGYRLVFTQSNDAAAIKAAGQACVALCGEALESMQNEGRAEVLRLVALVRDAAGMLVGEGDQFSSGLSVAMDRFDALARVEDMTLLKARLASEVRMLRQLVVERQQKWQDQVGRFQLKVATLETELASVRVDASLDPLTGIANRRHFETVFKEMLQSGRRHFVLATFDIDNFKPINDDAGHPAGDRVLQAVAKTLRSSFRTDDLVARIGGDEFVVIAEGVTLEQAEGRFKAVLQALSCIGSGLVDPPRLSMSCGIAEYSAGDTLKTLMQRSDDALVEAKRRGKGRLATKALPLLRDLR